MKRPENIRGDEFLDPKRATMMRQVSEDAPGKAGLFQRVFLGMASPREAIKAQCLHCCWMDEVGIRDCTATSCPLWSFRPYLGHSAKRMGSGIRGRK